MSVQPYPVAQAMREVFVSGTETRIRYHLAGGAVHRAAFVPCHSRRQRSVLRASHDFKRVSQLFRRFSHALVRVTSDS